MQTPKPLLDAQKCLNTAKKLLKEMEDSLPNAPNKNRGSPKRGASSVLIIDIDLISDLRRQQKHKEAEKLVKLYHRKLKISREKDFFTRTLEERQDYRKIIAEERELKTQLGICSNTNCTEQAQKPFKSCKRCKEQKANWRKKNGI